MAASLLACSFSVALWTARQPATVALIGAGVARPRAAVPVAQQGPMEDGFRELMPMATQEGNVDPELVQRIDLEVQALTGVSLEDLLNPSKVVNLERERLLTVDELAAAAEPELRAELEPKLEKIEQRLFVEKRTVFRGWLKGLFIGQSLIAVVLSGVMVFDAFPGIHLDLSLRALGFWSYWLFVIPSLRARRPRGWEKRALNVAFLGSPLLTLGMPFLTKDPAAIWGANLVLLVGCYAYGLAVGDGGDEVEGFSGPLRWLDFGSGQERGVRGAARERLLAKDAPPKPAATEADATSAASAPQAAGSEK